MIIPACVTAGLHGSSQRDQQTAGQSIVGHCPDLGPPSRVGRCLRVLGSPRHLRVFSDNVPFESWVMRPSPPHPGQAGRSCVMATPHCEERPFHAVRKTAYASVPAISLISARGVHCCEAKIRGHHNSLKSSFPPKRFSLF